MNNTKADDHYPQPGSKVWQLSTRVGELTAEATELRRQLALSEGERTRIALLEAVERNGRQQAEAERDRAVNAIKAHNADYGECDKKKCGYAPYKYRECPECPAQHKIDLAAIAAGGEGEIV